MKNRFFEVIELSLSDFPLSSLNVRKIVLYNSIESSGTVMELFYNDKSSIIEELPVIGGETIKLSVIDQYDNEISLEFILTEFSYEYQKDGLHTLIHIKAIENQAMMLGSTRINKYYEQQKVSDIVKNIIADIDIETTSLDQKVDVLIPGWSKTKTLTYLSNFAYSDRYGGNYLFFQTIDGQFIFKPINKLFDINEVNSYTFNSKNQFYRYNIYDFSIVRETDMVDMMYSNIQKRNHQSFDHEQKRKVSKTLKIEDVVKEVIDLEDGSLINSDIFNEFDSLLIEFDDYFGEESLNTMISNDMFQALFVKEVDVLMNGEFGLAVGDVVFLDMKNIREQTELSKIRGGNWMISKISYHLSDGEFKIKARLIRESNYDSETKYQGKSISANIVN